jgi:hypothetical protein
VRYLYQYERDDLERKTNWGKGWCCINGVSSQFYDKKKDTIKNGLNKIIIKLMKFFFNVQK